MIKIQHNLSGEVKEVSELEHHMMIDTDDWKVVKEVKKSKVKKTKKAKKTKAKK